MPVTCFVPPQILERIARNGTPEQRDWALSALAVDATIRLTRATASTAAPHRRRHLGPLQLAPGDQPNRSVHDAGGTERLPGRLARAEGATATGDAAADEAYDGLGATFAFYLAAYDRHSVDDHGLPLVASVHYGRRYDNAFWNGEQMVFGDGDGELFGRFTRALEVIGHELTHGVTETEAALGYSGQPGALNESISDVFGVLVKQYSKGQTADEADWLVGADLLAPGVHGVALRSMQAPGTAYDDPVLGKDDQPATMAGYVHATGDNGAVHTNSGIPNHAFYLAATAIGGRAWEVAGRIWYDALRDPRLRPTARFAGFAATTVRVAKSSYDEAVAGAVRDAWNTVGVPA
jgi:Zn-dependent metalloprotease